MQSTLMTNILLIDVRTPSHIKTVSQILLNGDFVSSQNMIVIAPESLSIPEWPAKLIKYSFTPSNYFSLLKILNLIKYIEEHTRGGSSFDYLSAVNFGPLYDSLNARLHFKKKFLYEDGISSYLSLKVSFRWLKFMLITAITGNVAKISSQKFFFGSNESPTVIYTDKPLLVRSMNLCAEIRILKSIWTTADQKSKSIYLLSSSSVEYGLCSLEDYKNLMNKISENYLGEPIIVSFHHNETLSDIKLNILRTFFQIERVVDREIDVETDMNESGKIIEVIAPFNTVALNLVDSGRANKMSLYDDKGPNMQLRKKFFQKLNLFDELEINIYE